MELIKIGRTYNCFDDGKVSKSRMYKVIITEIIPFKNADKELLKVWEEARKYHRLFDKTDCFIKFKSNENVDEPNGVFARTKDGGFFGLGNLWNSGRLDIDGSLTERMENHEEIRSLKNQNKELFGLIESIHHLFKSDEPITKDSVIGHAIELAYKTFKD